MHSGEIEIHLKSPSTPAEERARLLSAPLGFGRLFSDHMVTIDYRPNTGWAGATLRPYQPLAMDPASAVLHYSQSVFEGFKAFRQANGTIAAFRPLDHGKRLQRSARRLAIPELPLDLFMQSAKTLLKHDSDWVPTERGSSMYLRPLIIATERCLGVKPSKEYAFVLIGSPSGNYFSGGSSAVRVWVCESFVRAAPGGTGDAKFGGNYAGSLIAQLEAEQHDCAQVVWLDAVHRRHIEEMGGMNIFFVYQQDGHTTLVTPRLTGTLLPGITRDSILKLAQQLDYSVAERDITIDEWRDAANSGRMTEAFACGTAAVVTPIGEACTQSGSWLIGGGQGGPVAQRVREALLAIQYGEAKDTLGWMHTMC